MSHIDLGPTFRRLRLEKKMRLKEVAARVGTSVPSIAHWESGETSPRWKFVCALAECFGVSVESVIDESRRRKW